MCVPLISKLNAVLQAHVLKLQIQLGDFLMFYLLLSINIRTFIDLYFFLDAIFKSSCTLSSNHCRNSKASCCCVPLYCVPCLSTTCLKAILNSGVYWQAHNAFNSTANCSVTSPFVPNFFELSLFRRNMSTLYLSNTKYSDRTSVCEMHCKTAFMKHVFPWFRIPVTPGIWSMSHVWKPTGGTLFSVAFVPMTGTPLMCWAILFINLRNDGLRNTFLLLLTLLRSSSLLVSRSRDFGLRLEILTAAALKGFLGSVKVRLSLADCVVVDVAVDDTLLPVKVSGLAVIPPSPSWGSRSVLPVVITAAIPSHIITSYRRCEHENYLSFHKFA